MRASASSARASFRSSDHFVGTAFSGRETISTIPAWMIYTQQRVQGGFPLTVQRAGDKEPMFEVTSVEKKKLSDDLFTPPAGWQKMSMPMGMPVGRP